MRYSADTVHLTMGITVRKSQFAVQVPTPSFWSGAFFCVPPAPRHP